MSIQEVERFDGDLEANAALREEVRNCPDAANVVSLANAKGYNFTKDDLSTHIREREAKIEDDKLEKIAGGVPDGPVHPQLYTIP